MKILTNHRFWGVLFWVNAYCLATNDGSSERIVGGLFSAAACLLCIYNYNTCKPK